MKIFCPEIFCREIFCHGDILSQRYHVEGYFVVDILSGDINACHHLKCIKDSNGCKARGNFISNEFLRTSAEDHNYEPDPNLVTKRGFYDNIAKFSAIPYLEPHQVYKCAVSNDAEAAEKFSYAQKRSSIYYHRNKAQPQRVHLRLPDKTIFGFWQSLSEAKTSGQLKYGINSSHELSIHIENFNMKNGEAATNLFFYDSALLESISGDSIDIYVDATFRCPPKFLDCSVQLLTIMIKIKNTTTNCNKPIACMNILITNKAEKCYDNVFSFIKKTFPTFMPKSYMSDYEKGLHNALESAFPDIVARHCYFHYAQLGKTKPLGISVFEMFEDRTNNHMESFHRDLNALLAKHCHPNDFMNALKSLYFDNRIIRTKIQEGTYSTRKPKGTTVESNIENGKFWEHLNVGMTSGGISAEAVLQNIKEFEIIKKLRSGQIKNAAYLDDFEDEVKN